MLPISPLRLLTHDIANPPPRPSRGWSSSPPPLVDRRVAASSSFSPSADAAAAAADAADDEWDRLSNLSLADSSGSADFEFVDKADDDADDEPPELLDYSTAPTPTPRDSPAPQHGPQRRSWRDVVALGGERGSSGAVGSSSRTVILRRERLVSFSSSEEEGGGEKPEGAATTTTTKGTKGGRRPSSADMLCDEDEDIGLTVWGQGKVSALKNRNKDEDRNEARRRKKLVATPA